MNKKLTITILALFIMSVSVSAQTKTRFNKPIQSSNTPKASNDATYNIGITGGGTLTEWIHFGGNNTKFKQPIPQSLGIVGGIAFERLMNKHVTIGIEALYAIRQTELSHTLTDFPIGINSYNDIKKRFNVNYNEIDIQIPFSYYLGNSFNARFRPYVFAAPRVSIPLNGKMRWQKDYYLDGKIDKTESDTISMSKSNFKSYNIGLVLGAGIMMRINLSNYYFLAKLDASYHAGFINTHTEKEMNDNIGHVIGSSYIEPKLLEKRFSTDANIKLSLFFPLKKQLKGACMNWGEYD